MNIEKFIKFKLLLKWALLSSIKNVRMMIFFSIIEFTGIWNLISDENWGTFILLNIATLFFYIYMIMYIMYPSLRGGKNYDIKLSLKTRRKLN